MTAVVCRCFIGGQASCADALASLSARLAPFAGHVVSARRPAVGRARLRVDRSGRWGNPFHIGPRRCRAAAVLLFARRLRRLAPAGQAALLLPVWQHLQAGGALECWCAPALCHAQVLAAFALAMGAEYQAGWQP